VTRSQRWQTKRATNSGSKISRERACAVTGTLLVWRACNGRTFPWHTGENRFHLLCAEVLLRQTRADSVPPVLHALVTRYPDPRSLAAASELEIRDLIEPLGFASQRAAQLRAMSDNLVSRYTGEVPSSAAELAELPGIGRYTAGIVAATLGAAAPAVDTNVARVLCRVFGLTPSHGEPRKSANVWEAAEQLVTTRPGKAADLTWRLVDLAAAYCRPKTPHCADCPLLQDCEYGATIS
jgi:A/G-specific adenine glycosylase